MIKSHILGYARMGLQRELKVALERHWRGEIGEQQLEDTGAALRERHWPQQRDAGLDFVTVGDFAYYDHVANHIQLFGCEPARFEFSGRESELARYFTLAGRCSGIPACCIRAFILDHLCPNPPGSTRWSVPGTLRSEKKAALGDHGIAPTQTRHDRVGFP